MLSRLSNGSRQSDPGRVSTARVLALEMGEVPLGGLPGDRPTPDIATGLLLLQLRAGIGGFSQLEVSCAELRERRIQAAIVEMRVPEHRIPFGIYHFIFLQKIALLQLLPPSGTPQNDLLLFEQKFQVP